MTEYEVSWETLTKRYKKHYNSEQRANAHASELKSNADFSNVKLLSREVSRWTEQRIHLSECSKLNISMAHRCDCLDWYPDADSG